MEALAALQAHIKSGAPFPEGWYTLPDGLLFLGNKAFSSKLKPRQAYTSHLLISPDMEQSSHSSSLLAGRHMLNSMSFYNPQMKMAN